MRLLVTFKKYHKTELLMMISAERAKKQDIEKRSNGWACFSQWNYPRIFRTKWCESKSSDFHMCQLQRQENEHQREWCECNDYNGMAKCDMDEISNYTWINNNSLFLSFFLSFRLFCMSQQRRATQSLNFASIQCGIAGASAQKTLRFASAQFVVYFSLY